MAQKTDPVTLAFPGGMNNVATLERIPDGFARLIENADVVDGSGRLRRRDGYSAVSGATGGHSLWSHPSLSYGLYVNSSGNLVKIGNDGTLTNAATVEPAYRMSYAAFAGRAYYSNSFNMGYIDENGNHQSWGVDDPPAPLFTISSSGGVPAGRYQLAYTVIYNSGEESQPSLVRQAVLDSNGSITVGPVPNGSGYNSVNLYMSHHDGEELFFVANLAKGLTSLVISSRPQPDYMLEHLYSDRFPPMTRIAAFKHRIIGARGNELWFSDYRQVSICYRIRIDENNAEGNPAMFEDPITMIGPVENGVYVGTEKQLWWCQGNDPTEFSRIQIDSYGAMRHNSTFFVNPDLLQGDQPIPGQAVGWMSNDGVFCVGRSGGIVQRITDRRLAVAKHNRATLHYRESNQLRHFVLQMHERAGTNNRAANDPTVATVNQYGISQ